MDPQIWHKVAAISGKLLLLIQHFGPFQFFVAAFLEKIIIWFSGFKESLKNCKLWETGVAALGLGTYGAHGFKPQNPTYKEVLVFFFIKKTLIFHCWV